MLTPALHLPRLSLAGGRRRAFTVALAGLLALAATATIAAEHECPPLPGAGRPERVAAINWGLTQTLIALDIAPVAVADATGYRKWVAAPPLPDSSIDIGRRIEPSLTVLAGARPGLILMSSYYDELRRQLAGIAPVATLDIYAPDTLPLVRAREVARCLSRRFGRRAALGRLEGRVDSAIARLAARAGAAQEDGPVYVIAFRDADHVRVYGENSLFGGVLRSAGLENAWQGPTNFWGFATRAFTALDRAAGHLIVVGPVPREARQMMRRSPIWQALPAVRRGRVHRLAPVWAYGGLPSAVRFAELLGETLDDDG